MKIYISHPGSYDYEAELYTPIKQSALSKQHDFFLPHEPDNIDVKAQDILPDYDLMIAEVSYPSTGQGIEIGLAASFGVPIVCLHRSGGKISSALRFHAEKTLEYTDTEDLVRKIEELVSTAKMTDTLVRKHRIVAQSIQEAWQQKDTSLLEQYLADELEWHEGVFEKPLTAKQAVLDCWDAEVPAQTDLVIQIELLDFVDNRGYHRCRASWRDKRGKREVDAIFVIHINDEGKITYFMPWYENKT